MKFSVWPSLVVASLFVGCSGDGSSDGTSTEPTNTGVNPVAPGVNPVAPGVTVAPPTSGAPSVSPTDTGAPPSPDPTNVVPPPSDGVPTEQPGPVTSDHNPTTGPDSTPVAPQEPAACEPDTCAFEGGISNGCSTRFALGINYAWHDFGADFGGLAQWSMGGITANQATIKQELADMRANGVSVVRWWMFPDFRGDGVQFDDQDDPTGLSETALTDIQTALALAAEQDLYIVLTLFSFDNFRPTRTDSGVLVRGMTPLVKDPARRAKVIDNIVKPAARAAADSPHAQRLLGWDVINEPEWAIAESGLDDQDFTPNDELDAVTLDEMKALINETLTALAAETPNALRSVGWAAAKWAWAFNDVTNVDFHQPHIYGWVDQYWPYTYTPTELGYGDKPTVMGEFYMLPMPFSDSGNDVTFNTIVNSWYDNKYAGAWAWSYTDQNSGPANVPLIKEFAETKACEVSF